MPWWFGAGEPLAREAPRAGAEDDDAANDSTGGIAIAEGADGVPESFLVVVGPGGGAPEGEGNGICGDGASAVAEVQGSFGGGECGRKSGGVKEAIADDARRG